MIGALLDQLSFSFSIEKLLREDKADDPLQEITGSHATGLPARDVRSPKIPGPNAHIVENFLGKTVRE